MTRPFRTPLERLDDLEHRVQELEDAATTPAASEPAMKKRSCRGDSYPPRFTDAAAKIVLECFDSALFNLGKVTLSQLQDEVEKHAQQDLVPAITNNGPTIRALLAERAGLKVVWKQKTIESVQTSADPRVQHRKVSQ